MKNYKFTISGNTYEVDILEVEGNLVRLEVNGTSYLVEIHKQMKQAKTPTLVRPILKEPQKSIEKKEGGPRTSIKAPLPGVIVSIAVKEGDRVTKGQLMLVMEAMKMENEIKAPNDGEVISIKVARGQSVLQEENLIEIN
ncbi:MAG TPA: biotin/lipoyl-containing protein [Bacteroidales bacterium]|nr:biotin/lipoyl-containing protein [Bacteroidales bacterium]